MVEATVSWTSVLIWQGRCTWHTGDQTYHPGPGQCLSVEVGSLITTAVNAEDTQGTSPELPPPTGWSGAAAGIAPVAAQLLAEPVLSR